MTDLNENLSALTDVGPAVREFLRALLGSVRTQELRAAGSLSPRPVLFQEGSSLWEEVFGSARRP